MNLYPADAYQAELLDRYNQLKRDLAALLPGARIEHIGASSIPGASSKGDLDILLLVDPAAHEPTVERLKAEGYVEQTETLRTPELCMLNAPADRPEHALQVVAIGSQFEDFLRFRDALRSRPSLVIEYNQVKLSAQHLSEAEYRQAKRIFIERVLNEARTSLAADRHPYPEV